MIDTIDFNINNHVYVKLTDFGKQELKKQHEQFQKDFPETNLKFSLPKEDKNGYSKWQLHSLMQRFGHLMILGCKIPFETNIKITI